MLGLAGIMGGATSEISDATTDVLLEAAYFDPMAVARSPRSATDCAARRRPDSSAASTLSLALRAAARFVAILRESCPEVEWLRDPLDVRGDVPDAVGHRTSPGRHRTSCSGSTRDAE